MIALLYLLLTLGFSEPGSVGTDHFGGLNDTDSPATLQPYESQSLLNVESNITGTAIKKRAGFSKEADLSISTASVTGSHTYIDSNGSQIVIVCQDRNCAKSTNGSSFTVFYSSAASGITRWSFVDVNGKAFGANDKNDPVLQCCDGNTVSFPATIPAGSILELTKDRLVVSGVTANPNRVYESQSGVYTNFTTGPQSVDPWTDDFGTPGDKVTGLKYDRGRLYVFKRASITDCVLQDQYATQCFPVSTNIGTSDPAGVVSGPDGIYFRSQDAAFWKLSDDGLELISKKISVLVSSQAPTSSGVNSNVQTTQTDWNLGTISQSNGNTWDTNLIPGSILPSSWSYTDTSSSSFLLGTLTNTSTDTSPGNITLAVTTMTFPGASNSLLGWSLGGSWSVGTGCTNPGSPGTTYNAKFLTQSFACGDAGDANKALQMDVLDENNNVLKSTNGVQCNGNGCPGTLSINTLFVDVSTFSTKNVKVRVTEMHNGDNVVSPLSLKGRTVVGYYTRGNSGPSFTDNFIVDFSTRYITTGEFLSREFDSNISTPVFGLLASNWSMPSGSSVTVFTKSSLTSGGSFDDVLTSSGTKIKSASREFLKYRIVFNTPSSTQTPTINDVTLNAATTGQFFTQCIQPSASIASWGTFSCAEQKSGGGSISYFARSDKGGCNFISTGSWTAQTNNTNLTISTGLAVELRFDSVLGSATDQAQIDACTINWNNSGIAQPIWGVYDGIKNAIYWTTSINPSTSNNRILKFDLNIMQWFPFDIQASALKIINGLLYFGSPTVGKWYKYGAPGLTADDGVAINSYWRSKDFQGGDPFRESDWTFVNVLARAQLGSSITGLTTNSFGQQDSYTINLSTTNPYARSVHRTVRESPATLTSLQVGNNSSNSPWEVLGIKLDYFTMPQTAQNP